MGMRISRGFCPMPYTYIIISLIYTLIGYEPVSMPYTHIITSSIHTLTRVAQGFANADARGRGRGGVSLL